MSAGFASGRLLLLLFAAVALYLSLYSWNLKSRAIDRFVDATGLEFALLALRPGEWAASNVGRFWDDYVHLVDVERENQQLRDIVAGMALEMSALREDAARVRRLEAFLAFEPPAAWRRQGARVLGQAMGPAGVLQTVLLDKGQRADVAQDSPVLTPDGLVGRVLSVSPGSSTVLLIQDPNSRIPVVGRTSRVGGVLVGQGRDHPLMVNYVPVNAPLEQGEVLVTADMAGGLPKGIPVARVVTVQKSDISLFRTVLAEPLASLGSLEQVLLLTREAESPPAEPAPKEPAKDGKDKRQRSGARRS